MKVKIGNQIFDSSTQPIMIIFGEGEKELISSMRPQDMKFCSFPEGSNVSQIEHFMKGDNEDENQISLSIENDAFTVPTYEIGD